MLKILFSLLAMAPLVGYSAPRCETLFKNKIQLNAKKLTVEIADRGINGMGELEYKSVKALDAYLYTSTNEQPGLTYVLVNADYKIGQKKEFSLIGALVPNELMDFKDGTKYKRHTYDYGHYINGKPVINGTVTMTVKGNIVVITESTSSELGYVTGFGKYGVRVNQIVITLDKKGKPKSVVATDYEGIGNQDGAVSSEAIGGGTRFNLEL